MTSNCLRASTADSWESLTWTTWYVLENSNSMLKCLILALNEANCSMAVHIFPSGSEQSRNYSIRKSNNCRCLGRSLLLPQDRWLEQADACLVAWFRTQCADLFRHPSFLLQTRCDIVSVSVIRQTNDGRSSRSAN